MIYDQEKRKNKRYLATVAAVASLLTGIARCVVATKFTTPNTSWDMH